VFLDGCVRSLKPCNPQTYGYQARKEMYVGVPQNRLSVTVVECISTDGKAIPPLIIIPGVLIIETWFHEKMTGHKLVTVSASGYTNEGICLI
jgi:hypothetical protein